MKLNEAFPSAFLKASDLNGKTVTVTIKEVTLEMMGKGNDAEEKLIISFMGKDKKLVCNKTNARTIEKLHGDDTDFWIGKQIALRPSEVEFQGELVWAIRVSLQAPAAAAKPAAPPVAAPVADDDGGGDIPF